jgi:DNA-binding transcriptional LysR family regulator
MTRLQQISAFATAARHGGFAAAARELGTVPSTVAKAVSRLEAALGVKLFHRTTRQVRLTADGERVFGRCQRILAEEEELHAEAAGVRAAPTGTLRVDMPVTYGRRVLLPLLTDLIRRHPQLALDVRLQDAHADIIREGIDVAIRIGDLRDSTLVARPFASQALLLCASPAYLAEHGCPERIEQLSAHTAIVFRMPSTGRDRPWQFRHRGRAIELHPESRLRFSDGEAIVALARMGHGLVQAPDYMLADALQDGSLVEILPDCRPKALPISAVYPGARLLPPRMREFLKLLEFIRNGTAATPAAPRAQTAFVPSLPRRRPSSR